MDKEPSQPNNPWANLTTITTFDKGSSTCPSRLANENKKKKSNNKIIKRCSPNVMISSLINYICSLVEKDPEQKNNLYTLLCDTMQKMNVIDSSFPKVQPVELVEGPYMDAVYHLINVAKSVIGSDNAVSVPRPIWTYKSLYEDQFIEICFIAGGGFGNVFKAKHKLDEVEYAIKKIIVRPGKIRTILNYLEEVKTLAKLNHSNIVSYKQAWIEPYTAPCLLQLPSSRNSNRIDNTSESESNHSKQIVRFKSHSYSIESNKQSCRFFSESKLLSRSDNVLIKENNSSDGSRTDISFSKDYSEKYSCSFESDTDNNIVEVNSTSERISESDSDFILFKEESEETCNKSIKSNDSNDNVTEIGSGTSTEESSDESPENIKICQFSRENNLYTVLYIQMALCEKTLCKWLEERTDPTPVSMMTDMATQMLCGLNYIHSLNIVHHDIKPSNIFISTIGKLRIQLGDFGLACPLQKESHDAVIGTCRYAAPEQLKGDCNPKSDIYSLGIVLLELLVPMKTTSECIKTIELLKSDRTPPDLTSSHPKWIDLIKRLIQKNPVQRPCTNQLLEDLRIDKDLTITKLENENSRLKYENEKKDQIIRDQEIAIQKLQDQLAKLKT